MLDGEAIIQFAPPPKKKVSHCEFPIIRLILENISLLFQGWDDERSFLLQVLYFLMESIALISNLKSHQGMPKLLHEYCAVICFENKINNSMVFGLILS